jgi:hypothetical protein
VLFALHGSFCKSFHQVGLSLFASIVLAGLGQSICNSLVSTHEGLVKWKYPEMSSVDFLFEVTFFLTISFTWFSHSGDDSFDIGDFVMPA